MPTPSNIILANLTNPPQKGLTSPFIATAPDMRDGSRPADPLPDPDPDPTPTEPGGYDVIMHNGRDVGGYADVREPDGSLIFDGDALWANAPDWEIQHEAQRYLYDGWTGHDGSSGFVAGDNVPPGFDFYYTSEQWHPNGDKNGNDAAPGTLPVARISTEKGSHLSPTGKSFIMYDEVFGGPGQWGADIVMMKDIGFEIKSMWVEMYIRFDPTWWWRAYEINTSCAMKLFRCRRFSGTAGANHFDFGGATARSASPVLIQDLKCWYAGGDFDFQNSPAFRGYLHPDDMDSGNDYYHFNGDQTGFLERMPYTNGVKQGGSESVSWPSSIGDGNWHKINIFVQMDSAPGAADGQYEFWFDDVMEDQFLDVPWRLADAPPNIGWNEFSLGGNVQNYGDEDTTIDDSDMKEQWYQVSGFKIYNGKPS